MFIFFFFFKGDRGGGMDLEFGLGRCKLLALEWINNKVHMHSTGNYIQYPVINHMEKNIKCHFSTKYYETCKETDKCDTCTEWEEARKKGNRKESWQVIDGIRNLFFFLFSCVFMAVSKTREDAKFLVLAFPENSEDRWLILQGCIFDSLLPIRIKKM